jgi:hypothetical protein
MCQVGRLQGNTNCQDAKSQQLEIDNAAQALLNGMRQNVFLRVLDINNMNFPKGIKGEIDFYLHVNGDCERSSISIVEQSLPPAIWCFHLAKFELEPNVVFLFLREFPILRSGWGDHARTGGLNTSALDQIATLNATVRGRTLSAQRKNDKRYDQEEESEDEDEEDDQDEDEFVRYSDDDDSGHSESDGSFRAWISDALVAQKLQWNDEQDTESESGNCESMDGMDYACNRIGRNRRNFTKFITPNAVGDHEAELLDEALDGNTHLEELTLELEPSMLTGSSAQVLGAGIRKSRIKQLHLYLDDDEGELPTSDTFVFGSTSYQRICISLTAVVD